LPGASRVRRRTIPLWAKALILAVGYVLAAEVGNLLSVQRTFSTFWPPAGLFLAMLLISERKDWPVLITAGVLGNLCSDLIHARPILVSLGFSAANVAEALTGAFIVSGLVGARPRLASLREAFSFGAVGAVVAPLVGASLGTLVVLATVPGASVWTTWYTWWIGDALGIVLLGSLILVGVAQWDEHALRPDRGWWKPLRPLGWSLLVAIPFSVISFVVFAPAGGGTSWKFLVTPGLISCGIAGGPIGAATGLFFIALAGVGGMVWGAPAAVMAAPADAIHVLQAQAFFVVNGVAMLCLAGVIAENRLHAADARGASRRFRLLFENMREGVSYCHLIVDKAGNPVDWVYLQVNRAFHEITGLTDLVGARASEVLPEVLAASPALLEVYGQTALTGKPALFETDGRVDGRVLRVSVTSPTKGDFVAVFEDVTERVAGQRLLAESNTRLEKMVYDVAESMGSVVEARDPYTQGHQVRVAVLAHRIAREMGLPEDERDGISMAGLLHDIGKLRVPAEILTKPGLLSPAEMSLIREHPEQGYEILHPIDFPWPVADMVRQHHERIDGSGYPAGLKGDEILLSARILAVADVVEAMASHRPYRPVVGLPEAMEEVSTNPQLYDATVAAACLRLYARGDTGL
jgi:putative nucleotidyltransferase with HDIG domain